MGDFSGIVATEMRERSQEFWDKFAVLNLFDQVCRVGGIGGRTKAQKIVFLYELEGQAAGLKSGHYRFFRYQLGPFSAELANDLTFLKGVGFLTSCWELTDRGRFLFDYLSPAVSESREASDALRIADEVSKQYGSHSGIDLAYIIYKMNVPVYDLRGEKQKVKDIPIGLDILNPVQDKSLREIQVFDEETLKDLEQEFAIPSDNLEPSSRPFKDAIGRALAKIS